MTDASSVRRSSTPSPARPGPPDPWWPLRPGEHLLASIAILGLAAAAIVAGRKGEYEFFFYIGVMVVIMLAVTWVHRRVRLHLATLWALMAWAVLHLCGGMIPIHEPAEVKVLYNFWLIPGLLKYDQLIHAYGFGVTTWVCWQAIRARATPPHHSFSLLAVSVLAATGLGATNEVIEFAATKLVEKTNVGDYDNNAWDLCFNLGGSIIAAILIRIAAFFRTPTPVVG